MALLGLKKREYENEFYKSALALLFNQIDYIGDFGEYFQVLRVSNDDLKNEDTNRVIRVYISSNKALFKHKRYIGLVTYISGGKRLHATYIKDREDSISGFDHPDRIRALVGLPPLPKYKPSKEDIELTKLFN